MPTNSTRQDHFRNRVLSMVTFLHQEDGHLWDDVVWIDDQINRLHRSEGYILCILNTCTLVCVCLFVCALLVALITYFPILFFLVPMSPNFTLIAATIVLFTAKQFRGPGRPYDDDHGRPYDDDHGHRNRFRDANTPDAKSKTTSEIESRVCH